MFGTVRFLFTMVVFAGAAARAQGPVRSFEERTWESTLIEKNKQISKWFDGMADGLDLFLVGRRLTKRPNESTVRIENTMSIQEKSAPIYTSSPGVILKLPNVEEYWNLKFTSYDERSERRAANRIPSRQSPRQTNYGATVGLFRKLGDVRTSFEPRIELRDPLKVSHSIVLESVADLKNYEVNPKLEFYASPDKGTGIFVAANVNFQLTKVFSLTFINEGDYEDRTHLFSVLNGVSLGEEKSPTATMSYNLSFGSNNQPNYHLRDYTVSVSWSQLVYKRILDYSITPHLDFAEDWGFAGRAGLVFAVNLTF